MIDLDTYYGPYFHIDRPALGFQFVCGADCASRAIAWYGSSYGGYSHVDAIVMPGLSVLGPGMEGWLVGARADKIGRINPGVRLRPPAYEKVIRRCVAILPCSDSAEFIADNFLYSQLGKAYDGPAIWGFLLGRPWHSKGHWICSALQTERLRRAGLIGFLSDPDSQITPNGLLLILATLRARITVLPP